MADLAAWLKVVAAGSSEARRAVNKTLQRWTTDPDLAGIREPAAVAKLPADEQKTCRAPARRSMRSWPRPAAAPNRELCGSRWTSVTDRAPPPATTPRTSAGPAVRLEDFRLPFGIAEMPLAILVEGGDPDVDPIEKEPDVSATDHPATISDLYDEPVRHGPILPVVRSVPDGQQRGDMKVLGPHQQRHLLERPMNVSLTRVPAPCRAGRSCASERSVAPGPPPPRPQDGRKSTGILARSTV